MIFYSSTTDRAIEFAVKCDERENLSVFGWWSTVFYQEGHYEGGGLDRVQKILGNVLCSISGRDKMGQVKVGAITLGM